MTRRIAALALLAGLVSAAPAQAAQQPTCRQLVDMVRLSVGPRAGLPGKVACATDRRTPSVRYVRTSRWGANLVVPARYGRTCYHPDVRRCWAWRVTRFWQINRVALLVRTPGQFFAETVFPGKVSSRVPFKPRNTHCYTIHGRALIERDVGGSLAYFSTGRIRALWALYGKHTRRFAAPRRNPERVLCKAWG